MENTTITITLKQYSDLNDCRDALLRISGRMQADRKATIQKKGIQEEINKALNKEVQP
jgi:hypothetical protein